MKDNVLQKWALISEIVGGVAILITLIFIALEIQENTEATKRSNFETLQRELRAWRSEIYENDRNLEVFVQAVVLGEELTDPLSITMLQQRNVNLFSIYESAYYFYQSGDLGEEEWQRFYTRLCGSPRSNWELIRQFLSREFVEFADECRGFEGNP